MKSFEGTVLAVSDKPGKNYWSFSIFHPVEGKQVWVNVFDKKPDWMMEGARARVKLRVDSKGFWHPDLLEEVKDVVPVRREEVGVQRLIVRQSCLAQAVQFWANKKAVVDYDLASVLDVAREFEEWVYRS